MSALLFLNCLWREPPCTTSASRSIWWTKRSEVFEYGYDDTFDRQFSEYCWWMVLREDVDGLLQGTWIWCHGKCVGLPVIFLFDKQVAWYKRVVWQFVRWVYHIIWVNVRMFWCDEIKDVSLPVLSSRRVGDLLVKFIYVEQGFKVSVSSSTGGTRQIKISNDKKIVAGLQTNNGKQVGNSVRNVCHEILAVCFVDKLELERSWFQLIFWCTDSTSLNLFAFMQDAQYISRSESGPVFFQTKNAPAPTPAITILSTFFYLS